MYKSKYRLVYSIDLFVYYSANFLLVVVILFPLMLLSTWIILVPLFYYVHIHAFKKNNKKVIINEELSVL